LAAKVLVEKIISKNPVYSGKFPLAANVKP
jgi:hypothetical protein